MFAIGIGQDPQIDKKLDDRRVAVCGGMLALRNEVEAEDRVKGERVDDLTWTFRKDYTNPRWRSVSKSR